MVRRSFFLMLLAALSGSTALLAQGTGRITGRVTDASTQQPVVGANVTIGARTVITGADGRFAIAANPGDHTVTVSLVGYRAASRTVTVGADMAAVNIDVALTPEAVELAEIVVTGYGTQRAGNVSGAVKQVTAEEFNTGRVVSPEMLIQTKVAGVQVVDNNEPGGGLSVRIRGATSVNAASDPLFVVDGVPLGTGSGGGLSAGRNPLNFLNPNDIESITVLKDAASASIYGANAANGVVLITTKKGLSNFGVEYTGSVSGSEITRRPDMLNAAEFRAAVEAHADADNRAQLLNENTNWFDHVTRNALGQEHNVAVSSVGNANDLRVSVGYLNQEGIILGSTVERLSAGLNYTQRLFNDNLQVRTSLKGSRVADEFTPGGVLSNAAQMGPTQPVFDPTKPTGYYDWPGNLLTSADNPVAILGLAQDRGSTYRSIGNIQADYSLPFWPALKAVVNLGYDVTKATRETFTPGALHSQIKTGAGGTYYRRDETFQTGLLESYLNFNGTVASLPGTFDLVGGYSYNQGRGEYPAVTVTGISTDLLELNGVPTSRNAPQPTMWLDENKLISFFGRATYNLMDRYILTASLRRDGSSRFGPGNEWGTFPSVSFAWRLSEESFMRGLGALNDLKLRASWGKVGNQSFANYQQFTTYTVGDAQTQIWFDGEFVSTIRPNPADKNLKWEETTAYNVGFDVGVGRFTGTVDVYRKDTEDLIFTVPIAVGTNLSNYVTTNIGSMKNNGVEFTLSADVFQGGKDRFNYTADFTASHNTNELTQITPYGTGSQRIERGDVAGGVGTKIQVLTPGYAINSFYVYKHKMENGKPMYRDVTGLDSQGRLTGVPDGSIKDEDLFEDLNGDNKINGDDRRPFHDPAPKWILGHSSYMSLGKVDASFTMRAYLGNYVYNNVASNLGTFAEVNRGSPYNLHRSVLETGFRTPVYQSDYYIEDASFLRMDNLTLGYNLTYQGRPVRLFGSVQNVFTVTDYSGVDPTAVTTGGLNGVDNNIYPRSRTFVGGLNVRF